MIAADTEQLDLVFAALADPTRRAILARLTEGDAAVGELAAPFALSQPTITSHIKKLERAGLVTKHPDRKLRYCRLNPRPLQLAARWIGGYRNFFEASFDNLDSYVAELLGKEARDAKP